MISYCARCGRVLKADGPCPKCGALSRNILTEDWGHGKDSVTAVIKETEQMIKRVSNLEEAEFLTKLIAFLDSL